MAGGAFSSTAGGDADPEATVLQFVAQPVRILPLVAQSFLGRREVGQEHQGAPGIAHRTWREKEHQRPPHPSLILWSFEFRPPFVRPIARGRSPLFSGLPPCGGP